jgi:hypothetical protein
MSLPDLAAQRAVLGRVGSLEREASVLYAKQARARAQMAQLWGADQGVVVELAGTARIGQARAGGQLCRDERLVEWFPITLGLLELGVMRIGTMEILLAVSRNCTEQVQRLLDERLAERICPLDAVDVRRLVATTIPELEAELDPAAQQDRHEQARANRGVWAFGVQDGMARIGAEVTQLDARRWALDFAELVRAQKVLDDRNGVRRAKAQREADVFAELPSRLLGLADAACRGQLDRLLAEAAAEHAAAGVQPAAAPGTPMVAGDRDELVRDLLRLPVRKPTTLNVHTAMTTLLDLDQRSGWIEGMGPIPAMHARMLLATAALRRVAVEERTGVPLGVDPTTGPEPPWQFAYDPPEPRHREPRPHTKNPPVGSPRTVQHVQRGRLLTMLGAPMYLTDHAEPQHDPSTALRELAQIRDQTCDGPGCPRTASACELDHERAYADGGQTALWNLRHRSTRCHTCKHHGWTVSHDTGTAISTWTSPAGSSYDRHSPWQPPTPLPDDLVLPEPRLVVPGGGWDDDWDDGTPPF